MTIALAAPIEPIAPVAPPTRSISEYEDVPRTDLTHLGLAEGLASIRHEQLMTGELPSYRRGAPGSLLYQRSPLLSTFVHDVLGYFDPRSPWWDERSLHLISEETRGQFLWSLVRLRRHIRGFLAWQAEPDGSWGFFGRGSGLGPDANTTANAATALLELSGTSSPDFDASLNRNRRSLAALRRFRAVEGRYFTFLDARGRGYGWMNEVGRPLVGFDPVVNADVLRFLALVGPDGAPGVADLINWVLGEVERGPDRPPSELYPNPLCFFYAVARAWGQARLPGLSDLASRLLPQVLARQDASGEFSGPLSTALAAAILLDLEYEGPELERALAAIRRTRKGWGGWEYEEFLIGGFGSPAWTTALSMVVLARGQVRMGAGAP
jgi:hypothetical protein